MYVGEQNCGLSGMGITIPEDGALTTSVPWWQTAIQEISKIIPRTPTVPTYPTTLPTYPSTPPYTESYPQAYNPTPLGLPSWLPSVAIAGAAFWLLSRRRR